MKEEDILNALKYAKELPSLENRVQQRKKELGNIETTKNNSNAELFILERRVSKLKEDLEMYRSSIHDKGEELAYMNNELAGSQNFVNKIRNSEDYQIIRKVAKEEVDSVLENKKLILSLAASTTFPYFKSTNRVSFLAGLLR